MRAVRPKANNIWQVGLCCYIWYQSLPHWLFDCADGVVKLFKRGGLSYLTSASEGLVVDLIKSASCLLVIRVLGRQTQMWACIIRNKIMRTIRHKANNIWQVRSGCYTCQFSSILNHMV